MQIFLRDDVFLKNDARGIYLGRRGVDLSHRISLPEAAALIFLGDSGNPSSASIALSECLGDDSGPRWVKRILERWGPYLNGTRARKIDGKLLTGINLGLYEPIKALAREAAPASITWMVTLACNRRCPYCFYKVTPWSADSPESPPDTVFPFADAIRMVEEMGRIGAADLFLTGGEPLLRKDLAEIIAAASSAGVRPRIFTKFPVGRALANNLKKAGVYEVTVSLDSANARIAGALAGDLSYLAEAETAIRNLLEAGISLSVNAVATKLNLPEMDLLAGKLATLKVPRLTISPYSEPYPRRLAASRLVPDKQPLHPLVAGLNDRHGGRIQIVAGSAEGSSSDGDSCGEKMLCEIGLRSLDILPDGRVSRCRYLWHEQNLVVGDLKHESLMDVWDGPALRARYAPSTDLYQGTSCATCGSFSNCHRRGRCFLSAKMEHNRFFAPDARCTSAP